MSAPPFPYFPGLRTLTESSAAARRTVVAGRASAVGPCRTEESRLGSAGRCSSVVCCFCTRRLPAFA